MTTADSTASSKKSKTDQAIDYWNANKHTGVTISQAAHHLGITPTPVYLRLKLLAKTAGQRCPCCGHLTKTNE